MATIPNLYTDSIYQIRYDFETNKFRFYRGWVGPQTHIDIETLPSTIAASSCIYIDSATGSASGTGAAASAFNTILAAASACTATYPYALITNTALYAEDLSALNNSYFSGLYAVSGQTPTYTNRTIGFTPSDSNSIFVAATGSASGPGAASAAYNDPTLADTAASASKYVVFQDSGTYDITPHTIVSSGWIAALGQSPTVTINAASATYTASATTFHSAATTLISSDVLTNGNIVIAWRDGADGHGKFKIITPANVEIKGETQFDTDTTANTVFVKALSGGGFVVAFDNYWVGIAHTGSLRFYNSAGTATVNTIGFDGQISYASVAELEDGNIVVAYCDVGDSSKGKFARFNTSGTIQGSITEFESGSTAHISVCSLATGDFVIAFQDIGDSGKGKFRRYTSVGVAADGGTPVEFASGTTSYISICPLSTGNFVVIYFDNVHTGKFSTYNSSGTAQGSIVDFCTGIIVLAKASALSTDEFIILYSLFGDEASGYPNDNSYFVKYDSSGTKQGQTIRFDSSSQSGSISVLSDDSFYISYYDSGDSDYGKYIKNTSIYYNGITVSSAATLNGITFNGEDQEYLRRMFNVTAKLTAKWCEFKGVTDPIVPASAWAIYSTAEVDGQNNSIHDNVQGVYSEENTGTYKHNLVYRNTSGCGIHVKGAAASAGLITVEHNTFFVNSYGLQLESNNGTNETVKNNIFSGNTTYDIYSASAMSTTYSIVSAAKCNNVTASSGCTSANPLFVNTGTYDEDDTDLQIKNRLLGDYADSPAYMMGDDTAPDRDAGAWDVIIIGESESYQSVNITKPIKGIDVDYEIVGARKSRSKAGKTRSGKDAVVEVVVVNHDGITDANYLKLLDMVLADNYEVDILWNPTTYPNSYYTYSLIYETVSGSAKNYRNNETGKQDVKIRFERAFT